MGTGNQREHQRTESVSILPQRHPDHHTPALPQAPSPKSSMNAPEQPWDGSPHAKHTNAYSLLPPLDTKSNYLRDTPLDACSRRVLGWAIDPYQIQRPSQTRVDHGPPPTRQTTRPSRVPFRSRHPEHTSKQLWRACSRLTIDQSTGAIGVRCDNTMTE